MSLDGVLRIGGPVGGAAPQAEALAHQGPEPALADGATPANGDGFGLGWYGVGNTPRVFHSTEPAWNDRNLADLAKHLVSPLVFAHVRVRPGEPSSRRTATRSGTGTGCSCTTG